MPRKKKLRVPDSFDKVYATDTQIREAKSEIKFLENMLKADQAGSKRIGDVADIKRQIQEKEQFIEKHRPKKLRGQRANRMYAEAKKLKEEIKEAMPSGKDYFRPYPKGEDGHNRQADFERAVHQQMAFQRDSTLKKKVIRFKAIMARLDPQDPIVRNIENLRR